MGAQIEEPTAEEQAGPSELVLAGKLDDPEANPTHNEFQDSGGGMLDELAHALGKAMTQEHVDRLLSLGVPPAATIICGAARIRTHADFYEPDADGIMAVIIRMIDDGEVVDLLAFKTDSPARWWTRRGAHWALGADALDGLFLGQQLRLFRSPLSWLQAAASENGLCVLDWDMARRHVPRVEIIAEDLAHGAELNRALTIPAQRPRIHVPAEAAA